MKHRKLLSVIFCVTLLLCGCQETPEEVRQNMEEYGDNYQIAASEITYCPVDKLRETKMPETNGKSLTFPDDVDFSGVEDVEVLHLLIEKNFLADKNVEKYTALFGVDKTKLKKEKAGESSWGKSLYYDSEKEQNYLSLFENGGVSRMQGLLYDYSPNVIEKKYNIDKEDVSQVKVSLADGEVNLADLCKDTEKWLEDNVPIDGIRYKVSDVYIRKPEDVGDGARMLSMCAEYEHKGIRFNNHTMPLNEEQNDFSIKDLTAFLAVELGYGESGIPSFFSRNMDVTIDSTEPVEKVVDLESAVNIVKETLSGFGPFHISEVLPLYALWLKDNSEAPGAEIEARPVYAFLIRDYKEDMGTGVVKINNCKNFFLVDMITGELTTDLDIGRDS